MQINDDSSFAVYLYLYLILFRLFIKYIILIICIINCINQDKLKSINSDKELW